MIKKLFFLIAIVSFSLFSTNLFSQNTLSFDGTNDEVTVSAPVIENTNSRTVEAWIKCTTNSIQRFILDMGQTGAGNGARFSVKINPSATVLRVEIGGGGINGVATITDDAWHHVAVVYDNSASSYKYKLYVDGVLDAIGDITIPLATPLTGTVKIGVRNDGGIGYFKGSVDEVRIWDVARTSAQIQNSMNNEICTPQTGLLAYFKLNEGIADGNNTSITTATDFSGNNYSATLTNFTLSGTNSNWVTGATLTQQTIDNSVLNDNAGTLTANETGATYQWIDCNNANAPISGATSQTFSPTTNGSYAVQLTKNGCTATSSCESVTTLGLTSNEFAKSISMYPNPTNGLTNIQLNQSFETIEATVYNVTGQTILNKEFKNTNIFSLDINSSNGIYFLAIKTNSGENAVLKVVKE